MIVQTPEIKLRDLGYFEFQLKMMNIVKTGFSTNHHNKQGDRQQFTRTDSKKIFIQL